MKKTVEIEHVSIELKSSFESFTWHLEKALGVLSPSTLHALGADPASMSSYLNNSDDENNLVLFNMLTQEDPKHAIGSRKIRQYQVGNPAIMRKMIGNNAGAGLYTPIHLLVYEKPDGKVMVQYDLPSSLFAQFNNTEILSSSITLEKNIDTLVRTADEQNYSN